jgi:HK97 family phage prohead protease
LAQKDEPMKNDTITVPFTLDRVDTRSDGKLRLKGVAAVFDSPSEDIGFREQIEPGAFTEALRSDDPMLLWQHDDSKPLARASAGNLLLRETSRGLEFEAELADTSTARDAIALVKSGVVRAMSFAFSMTGGKDKWETRNGESWRIISKIGQLFEISLVSSPAYATTSVQARQLEARATTATRGRLKVKETEAYYPGSPYSYFRDLWMSSHAEWEVTQAVNAGQARVELLSFGEGALPHPVHGGLEEARQRLATVERRDVTAGGAAAGFTPASGSLPTYLAGLFSDAARAEAVVARELPQEPLPPTGMVVYAPRLSTGAAVSVQASEAAANAEGNVDDTSEASAVAYISGQVDVSQQAWDRSADPGFDAVIAQDLGAALGTAIDSQILIGTNANGQTLGLLNTASALSVAATDASPTPAEWIPKTWSAYSSIAGSSGQGVSDLGRFLLILHPRRLAWLHGTVQNSQIIRPDLPGRVIASGSTRTTLGTGTNEDEAWLIVPDMLPIFMGEVKVLASQELAGTLQVRFHARQPFATGFGRAPLSICRISGTAMTAPSL